MTRGLRNNNPLNIEKTRGGNPWQGEVVPSKDKHTDAYVRTVAERSGVPADSRITTTNRDVMVPIVAAMSFVENGVEAKMLDVQAGWELFVKA